MIKTTTYTNLINESLSSVISNTFIAANTLARNYTYIKPLAMYIYTYGALDARGASSISGATFATAVHRLFSVIPDQNNSQVSIGSLSYEYASNTIVFYRINFKNNTSIIFTTTIDSQISTRGTSNYSFEILRY